MIIPGSSHGQERNNPTTIVTIKKKPIRSVSEVLLPPPSTVKLTSMINTPSNTDVMRPIQVQMVINLFIVSIQEMNIFIQRLTGNTTFV